MTREHSPSLQFPPPKSREPLAPYFFHSMVTSLLQGTAAADRQGKSCDFQRLSSSKFNKLAAKNFNQIFNLSSL